MIVTADVVLPVSAEPIRRGALVIEGERIQAVGSRDAILATYRDKRIIDYGRAIVLPGLVNAHAHLEYTALGPFGPPQPFLPWIQRLVAVSGKLSRNDWLNSAREGARSLLAAGITCVADVVTFGPGLEATLEAGLRGVSFVEAVGLRGDDVTEQLSTIRHQLDRAGAIVANSRRRIGLAPHSVYTVSSAALGEIGKIAAKRDIPITIHLAETDGECQLVQTGTGELAEALRRIGGHDLIASGGLGVSPVEHLRRCGLLHRHTTVVHAVHVSEADVTVLADKGVGVALCPRSNHFLQVGEAPVARLWREGVTLGVGTDSLASNQTLDLFAEIRLLRIESAGAAGSPPDSVPSRRDLVRWITLDGARLLGLDGEIGSLEPGKMADLAIVSMLAGYVDDPYDFLVEEASADDVVGTIIGGAVAYRR